MALWPDSKMDHVSSKDILCARILKSVAEDDDGYDDESTRILAWQSPRTKRRRRTTTINGPRTQERKSSGRKSKYPKINEEE